MRDPEAVLTRRRLLQFAGGGYLGLHLGGLWQAQAVGPNPTPAGQPIRACILIFYYGGPSHLDTFDPKPNAPAEVRGEFKPIATSVPGVQVCEHLPQTARLMHKVALIRSMTHTARLHDSAAIHALTGRPLDGPDRELFSPLPQVYPSYGSAVAHLRRDRNPEVPFAALPFPFRNVVEVPCQGGGFLGAAYDPLRIEAAPAARRYQAEMLQPAEGSPADRRQGRRRLLEQLERGATPGKVQALYEKAYRLLDSEAIRRAVDITREPSGARERYGVGADPVAVGEGGGGGNGAEMGYAASCAGRTYCWPAAWSRPACRS